MNAPATLAALARPDISDEARTDAAIAEAARRAAETAQPETHAARVCLDAVQVATAADVVVVLAAMVRMVRRSGRVLSTPLCMALADAETAIEELDLEACRQHWTDCPECGGRGASCRDCGGAGGWEAA